MQFYDKLYIPGSFVVYAVWLVLPVQLYHMTDIMLYASNQYMENNSVEFAVLSEN